MTDPARSISPDRHAILLKVGLRLTAERDLERLLHMIIEETTAVMDADRSSLFLIDAEKGEMWAKIAQGVEVVEIRFPLGKGIAGTVGRTGEVINIPDAYADSRFNPEFDGKTGFRTRSILCVPMKNMSGGTIGAIQVLNKKDGPFGADDAALLTALASQAAVAIENADLTTRLRELNLSLEQKVRERTVQLTDANERLMELNRELETIAITDGLTRAYNRRYFMERLKQEVKRLSRYGGTPMSLLMIDIDHFKKVNDTYGHQAGDAVLAGVSELVRSRLRDTDIFARCGGEEFSLIAPETDHAGALVLAERLRSMIGQAAFDHASRSLKVTVSMGLATWTAELKDDYEKLFGLADAALYKAKESGRNRVCR